MKKIVLRADAGKKTGYGHFIRSLALADYLKNDFECYFASFNSDISDGQFSDYQRQEICGVCSPWECGGNSLEEFDRNFSNSLHEVDIVVLDNYYFSTEYQKLIRNKGHKLVCIDDLHDRHMVCDLLMTGCPLKKEDFSVETYTRFIGGMEWSLLRPPFLQSMPFRNIRSKVTKVVNAMGGADAFNLTDKMIKVIHRALPEVVIYVIAGDTAKVSYSDSSFVKISHRLSAEEIVQLFDEADFGVFPASTICKEAYVRKLPVVAGYYVDNQRESYEYGRCNDLFKPLGCFFDDSDILVGRLKQIVETDRPLPTVIDFRSQREKIVKIFHQL